VPGVAAELGLWLEISVEGLVELPVAAEGLFCGYAGEAEAVALVEEPESAALELELSPELSAGFLVCVAESAGYATDGDWDAD